MSATWTSLVVLLLWYRIVSHQYIVYRYRRFLDCSDRDRSRRSWFRDLGHERHRLHKPLPSLESSDEDNPMIVDQQEW